MAKRKANGEIAAAFSKKLQLEATEDVYDQNADGDDFDNSTCYSEDTVKEGTSYTAITSASARSRKFPSDLKTIKCTYPDCNKTFNRPARLAAHLRSHTDDRPFRCNHDGCDKTYREEKHLRQHIKGSHTQERSYTCTTDGCGKSFLTATRLRRHQDVHAGQERFRCRDFPPCNQTFRKHNTLQRHIRAEHQGGPAYVCQEDSCTAGFDSQGALRNHMKREHSTAKFFCDECARADQDGELGDTTATHTGFSTFAQLQTHLRKEHLNCIFCDKKCKGQYELEKHVELHHSGIPVEARKTIVCTWEGCDKKFTKRNNLNAHIRSVHEGHRFVCGDVDLSASAGLEVWKNDQGCGTGFVTKANLEVHVRHIHLGVQRLPPRLGGSQDDTGASAAGRRQKKKSVIDTLTGASRTLLCSVQGCSERFIRNHDLQLHIQNHPAVKEEATPSASQETPSPSVEENILRLAEATEPPNNATSILSKDRTMPDLPFLGTTQPIAYRAAPSEPSPDEFWVGAHPDVGAESEAAVKGGGSGEVYLHFGAFRSRTPIAARGPIKRDPQWERDQAAMRALIDDDFDQPIDPALGGM